MPNNNKNDLPLNFPFQFRVCRSNQDIKLLTTHNTTAILQLIKLLNLEDKIAQDLQLLLHASPEKKTSVIVLHNYPEEDQNYAYAALLECDLCGIRNGFFAMFKSLSGNTEILTRECKLMYEFLNAELQKEQHLREISSHFPADRYSNN
jgi:hypothetical protein